MQVADTRWLTMMSTWHVRFRLAVQFPKKSSHLENADAARLKAWTMSQASKRRCWHGGMGPGSIGARRLDNGEVAHQVKGSLSAQS